MSTEEKTEAETPPVSTGPEGGTRQQQIVEMQSASLPQIKQLGSLEPDNVINFWHQCSSVSASYRLQTGTNIGIAPFIAGGIIRELENVYQVTTNSEIKEEVIRIKGKYDTNRQEDAFLTLKRDLDWRVSAITVERAVDKYFATIKKVMSGCMETNFQMEKNVVKLAIKKLPKDFGVEKEEYTSLQSYLNAGLSRLLPADMALKLKQEEEQKSRRLFTNESLGV